jgi:hypothetical protein
LQGDLDVYLDQSLYHARVLLVESNEIHHTGEIDENIDTPSLMSHHVDDAFALFGAREIGLRRQDFRRGAL